MFVCICHAVKDTEVQAAIEGGADCREAVTRACGAGGDCGACHEHIEKMIASHRQLVSASSLKRERAA